MRDFSRSTGHRSPALVLHGVAQGVMEEAAASLGDMSAHDVGARRPRWWQRLTIVVPVAGLAAVVACAVTDHPHRAVLALAATLGVMAFLRLLLPGRPWFASRNRCFDSALLAGVGLALWYFSPFTATMGVG